MGWMAILVGPTASGKSSLVHLLALLTGHRLRVMAMNSAMDTTELLGGFEQVSGSKGKYLFRIFWQAAVQSGGWDGYFTQNHSGKFLEKTNLFSVMLIGQKQLQSRENHSCSDCDLIFYICTVKVKPWFACSCGPLGGYHQAVAAGVGEHGLCSCHGDAARTDVIGRGGAGHRVPAEHVEHIPLLAAGRGTRLHRGNRDFWGSQQAGGHHSASAQAQHQAQSLHRYSSSHSPSQQKVLTVSLKYIILQIQMRTHFYSSNNLKHVALFQKIIHRYGY